MNKITQTIFERAYQSYLCGGDIYTYRFESSSTIMQQKYKDSIKYLENKGFIEVISISETKVRLTLTELGIQEGNAMSV